MKYIIESNDVIGYTPKYAMLFGDGYMIQRLEDLEELNSDYINENFGELQDTAYKKGLHDGESKCRYCNEYQRGLDDAWEAARKALYANDYQREVIFGDDNIYWIMKNHAVSEAIYKLKAYEEKQKEEDDIKLGDELEHTVSGYTSKAIFLEKIEDDEDWWYTCLFWTSCGFAILSYPKSQFKRTGKHFDIDKFLEEMRT